MTERERELHEISVKAIGFDETELEQFSDNYSVRIIQFARENAGLSFGEFSAKAEALHWLQFLDEMRRQCFIAFGCAVLARITGRTRLSAWDYIMGTVLTNHNAYNAIVNSYYENKTDVEMLEGVIAGLYAWWHNETIYKTIYCALYHGYSETEAYAAKVMAF